jgi:hypothetical protein
MSDRRDRPEGFLASRLAAVAMVVATSSGVFAQAADDPHAAKPERPTVATHAWTVAPKYAEVETGVELDRDEGLQAWNVLTPTVLKIGAGPRAQLSLQSTLVSAKYVTFGVGDSAVSLKYRIVDDHPLLGAFAVQPGIKFPSGGVERGTNTTDMSLLLISSHDVRGVSLDLNFGYSRAFGTIPVAVPAIYPPLSPVNVSRNTMWWTASTGGSVHNRLGFAAELFGYPATAGVSGTPASVAVLGGPTFTLRPWAVIDAGAIIRLRGDQPHALYAGLVYNLGKF